MNYKINQKLYSVYIDEDTTKTEVDTWIVRTIRGGNVFAVKKNSLTWGKRSKRQGDFGWIDKNIDRYNRRSVQIGGKFRSLHTTKRQAWMQELQSYRSLLGEYDGEEWGPTLRAIIKKCESMVKRASKK